MDSVRCRNSAWFVSPFWMLPVLWLEVWRLLRGGQLQAFCAVLGNVDMSFWTLKSDGASWKPRLSWCHAARWRTELRDHCHRCLKWRTRSRRANGVNASCNSGIVQLPSISPLSPARSWDSRGPPRRIVGDRHPCTHWANGRRRSNTNDFHRRVYISAKEVTQDGVRTPYSFTLHLGFNAFSSYILISYCQVKSIIIMMNERDSQYNIHLHCTVVISKKSKYSNATIHGNFGDKFELFTCLQWVSIPMYHFTA
jgi:hypothetical protein